MLKEWLKSDKSEENDSTQFLLTKDKLRVFKRENNKIVKAPFSNKYLWVLFVWTIL